MKFKLLMILCAIFLFSFSVVTANEHYISDVTGLTLGGTIPSDGSTVTFTIGLNNTGPDNITGFTNGFRIYSPDGAEWGVVTRYFQCNVWDGVDCTDSTEVTVDDPWDFSHDDSNTLAAFTGSITTGMLESTFINEFSITGSGADTVGFGGFRLFAPGIPVGDMPEAWTITIGPVDPMYDGTQICIDSSFYPPAGQWAWSTPSSEVEPFWAGPSCYTIGVPPPPPSLNPIGDLDVNECEALEFTVTAVDTSDQNLIYLLDVLTPPLPDGAIFNDNEDNTGTFTWTPDNTQAGSYEIEFIASLKGVADTVLTTITVINNEAPTVDPSGPFTALADCQEFAFTVPANDPESQPMTYSSPNLPAAATLNPTTGEFNWTPVLVDVGIYIITFDVTDDCDNTTSIDVTFEVIENTAPVITDIPDESVIACDTLTFTATATDNESSIISYSITDRPVGATFNTVSGEFHWILTEADLAGGGIYNMIITATDECGLFDSDNVQITVTPDIDPDITVTTPQEVTICKTLSFGFSAVDPQNTDVTLSVTGLDADAVFTDNGDGTGNITWTPEPTDVGPHDITILASDECGPHQNSKIVTINVDEDSDPVFTNIGDDDVTACATITFGLTANDPDGDDITFRMTNTPTGAVIEGNIFTWTPTSADVAAHTVTFYAADECGSEVSQDVIITVNANLAVAFDDAANEIVDILDAVACKLIEFTFTATDPEGVAPVFSGANLPGDATVTNEGNRTGKFSWTPTAADIAAYTGIEIIVSDNCDNSVTETFDITVFDDTDPTITIADLAPTVKACKLLEFTVTADDVDDATNALVAITYDALPGDAVFTDNGGGDGSFSWTPTPADVAGSPYTVTFTVTDGCGSTVTEAVVITVEADDAPVLVIDEFPDLTNDTSIVACNQLVLHLTANVSDGESITFSEPSSTYEPAVSTFEDNGDGTAVVSVTPAVGDTTGAEVYKIFFEITDACGSTDIDSLLLTVTPDVAPDLVVDLNTIPESIVEGAILTFTFSASDPVYTTEVMTFGLSGAPEAATVSDPTKNEVTFSWETVSGDAGDVSFWLLATDECGTSDSEQVSLTVVANSLPTFDGEDIQAQIPESPQQGDSIILDIIITDADIPASGKLTTKSNSLSGNAGIEIWVDTASIPDDETKWSMTDNGDGTAKFIWATDLLTPAGDYTIIFFASDGVNDVSFDAIVGIVTSVAVLDGNGLPNEFYLTQNYPNPFNPETEIQFGVPERAYVSLAVYNVLGQKIKTLVDEVLSANRYTTYWDGSNDHGLRVASGIYFYKLETDQYHETKKMIMIK